MTNLTIYLFSAVVLFTAAHATVDFDAIMFFGTDIVNNSCTKPHYMNVLLNISQPRPTRLGAKIEAGSTGIYSADQLGDSNTPCLISEHSTTTKPVQKEETMPSDEKVAQMDDFDSESIKNFDNSEDLREEVENLASVHPAQQPTEPATPDVISQAADSTVSMPSISDEAVETVQDQGVDVPDITGVETPKQKTDDMPSFDEWKVQKLKEEAEKERNKQQETVSSQPSPTSQNKQKAATNRANYASASCGAKIVGSNAEAQSVAFVLSENKDKYMIQPCKVKKWFVVELCEPLQVSGIELGNLEFFSSQPESFVVNASDRFPTKEWTSFGTFHARDIRTVQSFSVNGEKFAKYIKIEMLSHFGQEHYCPMTVVRVHGSTVDEDDTDETEDSFADEDGFIDFVPDGKSASLLEMAIDTAQSMLKDVLSTNEENKPELDDVASVKPKNDSNQTKPCPPEVKSNEPVSAKHKSQPISQPEIPMVSVLPPIVRLVETPISSLSSVLAKCEFCDDGFSKGCMLDRNTVCGYFRWMTYVYPSCCKLYNMTAIEDSKPLAGLHLHDTPVLDVSLNDEAEGTITISEHSLILEASRVEHSSESNHATEHFQTSKLKTVPANIVIRQSSDSLTNTRQQKQPVEMSSTHEAVVTGTLVEPSFIQSTDSLKAGKTLQGIKSSSQMISSNIVEKTVSMPKPQATKMSPSKLSTDLSTQISPEPSSPLKQMSCDSSVGNACHMGPNVQKIRPTKTEELLPVSVVVQTEQSNGQKDSVDTKPTVVDNADNNINHIYADEVNDMLIEDIEPSEAELDEDVQITKKPQLKETTFMRLRNRMKELELNMNLSSRYLEELSQRYRRQMEEMYLSLNSTIQKLSNTSSSAEARDAWQQKEIKVLRGQVSYLNTSLAAIKHRMDSVNQQVIMLISIICNFGSGNENLKLI